MSKHENLKIAVIGGGIAGILSSYLLARKHQVTLFEKNDYLGGHTNTIEVETDCGQKLAVDTGFIVLNDRTYPTLHAFFKEIGVEVRYTNMSFGYWDKNTSLQYSGDNLFSLFADYKNLFNYQFLKMLWQLKDFNSKALYDLEHGKLSKLTLAEYLKHHRRSQFLANHYIIPMAAAIWSSPDQGIEEFPAESLLRFFKNHGLLTLNDRPRWQTVVGGSCAYVNRFCQLFRGRIELSAEVETVLRKSDNVCLGFKDGHHETFDKVIIAAHADQALLLLKDASSMERELLSTWQYQDNHTVLHTDRSQLPPLKKAWSAWNYVREVDGNSQHPVSITYHMNTLQGFNCQQQYCVTLNPRQEIAPSKIIKEIYYKHPVFSSESVETQMQFGNLQGVNNTYYAGSYFGWGFHEDAARSALQVGRLFSQGLVE